MNYLTVLLLITIRTRPRWAITNKVMIDIKHNPRVIPKTGTAMPVDIN